MATMEWLGDPKDEDYAAAHSFLSMLVAPASLDEVVARLRTAPTGRWAAKDVLRASGLSPLKPKQSAAVAKDLAKVDDAKPISPVLLVGGLREYLVIADGYHRVSAAHRIDEDTMVPGRLLWLT